MSSWQSIPLLLKPDALDGSYASVLPERASDCFHALIAFLEGTALGRGYVLHNPASISSALDAFRQVTERAQSEEAFAAPIIDGNACKSRLLGYARIYQQTSEPIAITQVIKDAAQAFGMRIIFESYLILSEHDIDVIYHESITEDGILKSRLYGYLAGKLAEIVVLEGNQSMSALQVIKTYVRYFFRYQPGTGHLLENLVHVPDGHDIYYLQELSNRLR
jgi:hypothetical protein